MKKKEELMEEHKVMKNKRKKDIIIYGTAIAKTLVIVLVVWYALFILWPVIRDYTPHKVTFQADFSDLNPNQEYTVTIQFYADTEMQIPITDSSGEAYTVETKLTPKSSAGTMSFVYTDIPWHPNAVLEEQFHLDTAVSADNTIELSLFAVNYQAESSNTSIAGRITDSDIILTAIPQSVKVAMGSARIVLFVIISIILFAAVREMLGILTLFCKTMLEKYEADERRSYLYSRKDRPNEYCVYPKKQDYMPDWIDQPLLFKNGTETIRPGNVIARMPDGSVQVFEDYNAFDHSFKVFAWQYINKNELPIPEWLTDQFEPYLGQDRLELGSYIVQDHTGKISVIPELDFQKMYEPA